MEGMLHLLGACQLIVGHSPQVSRPMHLSVAFQDLCAICPPAEEGCCFA